MRPTLDTVLRTPRLTLQPPQPDQAQIIVRSVLAERDRVEPLFARTIEAAVQGPDYFLAECQEDWTSGVRLRLFLWEQAQLRGNLMLRSLEWEEGSAELAYYLLAGGEGRGLALEGCSELIRWARETLQLHDLWLRIIPGTERSESLATRLGFVADPRPAADYIDAQGVAHPTRRFRLS